MLQTIDKNFTDSVNRLPSWFRQEIPDMEKISRMKAMFRSSKLHTVCQSARCPNMGKCWGEGVATFMILGEICTRACRFCAVKAGRPLGVDTQEPPRVARAVERLDLRYVVITSVARDDLEDEGAEQFCKTIDQIRSLMPKTKIEVLIPDFSNRKECLQKIFEAKPDVIGHNLETVRRLSLDVRPQADYQRSLEVLGYFKKLDSMRVPSPLDLIPSVSRENPIFTKSSLMVGLGETKEEVIETMKDLLEVGCDILTIGQYLAPTKLKRHIKVQRFVPPEEFTFYKYLGLELGFKNVMSAPLVRSSFIAEQGYQECLTHVRE